MNARQIRARMAEKNVRQVDLVKKWKVRASTVSMLINGQIASERLERRLARELGITFEQLRGEAVQQ
jgi:plasmid maintenance system antidote protein VapI